MTVKGRLLHFWYEFDFYTFYLNGFFCFFFILMQSIRNGRYSSIWSNVPLWLIIKNRDLLIYLIRGLNAYLLFTVFKFYNILFSTPVYLHHQSQRGVIWSEMKHITQCHCACIHDAENVNLFILGFNLFSLFYSLTHTEQGYLFKQ